MDLDVAVIIPARIRSTRLPRKLLESIGNKTMIEHVVDNVKNSGFSNICVATDSEEIAKKIQTRGLEVIMTDVFCPTGTDRVYEALNKLKIRDKIKYVVNVQGDMPFINSLILKNIIYNLKNLGYDIMTPVVKVGKEVAENYSNVKVIADRNMKALYFSRFPIPYGSQEFLYHIGIYGFTRDALNKFVNLKQSEYELAEKLEQLRALQHGINIGICYCDEVPISVDTAEDLKKAREYFVKMRTKTC